MKTRCGHLHSVAALFICLTGCGTPSSNPTLSTAAAALVTQPAAYHGLKDLYVADDEAGTIVLLKNDGYASDGTISAGVNGPYGITLDTEGNLYVANRAGGNVTEYAPGSTQPSFTYSAGMTQPLSVTVDRQGNLFETDVPTFGSTYVINEYAQQSNVILHSCTLSGIFGVAVDAAGNVFVDYNPSGQGGRVEEFKGGLAGCSPVELGARPYHADGMALDNSGNLLIADYNNGTVDLSKPPYTKINRRLGQHFGQPVFVSIDKANKHLYLAVITNYWQYLYVLDYPSGRKLRRLGPHHGILIPNAAVDGPNDVP